ncbi:unnamed protein product, partial [Prorocentrum cordatum]
ERLDDVSKLDRDIIKDTPLQAEEKAAGVLRRCIRAGYRECALWARITVASRPGAPHRTTKNEQQYEGAYIYAEGRKHDDATVINAE